MTSQSFRPKMLSNLLINPSKPTSSAPSIPSKWLPREKALFASDVCRCAFQLLLPIMLSNYPLWRLHIPGAGVNDFPGSHVLALECLIACTEGYVVRSIKVRRRGGGVDRWSRDFVGDGSGTRQVLGFRGYATRHSHKHKIDCVGRMYPETTLKVTCSIHFLRV